MPITGLVLSTISISLQTLLCFSYNWQHHVTLKGKNCHTLLESVGGVLISLFHAIAPIGGYTTESVTHGQCDARPTVTFPVIEHHCPAAGTKLYCTVTEAHVCEQLKARN